MSETEDKNPATEKKKPESDRYQTPARLGWGATAEWLHPRIAKIGELGPLGGRLSKVPTNKEYYAKLQKEKEENDKKEMLEKKLEEEEEEREEEARGISTMDLFLLLGFFLFSAGLIVVILILPLPNMWTLNLEFVLLAVGVLVMGLAIFMGAALPCLLSSLWRSLCCRGSRDKKKVILVSPKNINNDVDQLIASVYTNEHKH